MRFESTGMPMGRIRGAARGAFTAVGCGEERTASVAMDAIH
jgi:hypothetical protein